MSKAPTRKGAVDGPWSGRRRGEASRSPLLLALLALLMALAFTSPATLRGPGTPTTPPHVVSGPQDQGRSGVGCPAATPQTCRSREIPGRDIPQGAGSVIATIPVGCGPFGAAYDSALGEIFVANSCGDSLSVINAATQSVVATIALGGGNDPQGVAYDVSNGYIYTANPGGGTISIVDAATNTLLATLAGGYYPWGIAYDDRTAEVYVANDGSGNTVKVVSGLSIVGSIPVGSSPDGVTYDGENGYVYTANSGTRTVTIISGATNTVVGTLSFSGWFPYWVAYGAKSGDVYVADSSTANVWVVSGYTNALVATIPMPSPTIEMAYDSGNNDAYATAGCYIASSSVYVIDGSSNSYLTAIPVGTNPCGVTYDAGNGDLYVANSGSNTVSVISTSNPVSSVPSASPTSVDLSQSTTFSTVPSGGVPPYTYTWNGLPAGCTTSSTPTLPCTPTASGSSLVTVTITDSTGTATTSGALHFHVYPDPTVTGPRASPPTVDANQSVTFNTTAGGGTGNYTTYTWAESSPSLGCAIANAPILACTPTTNGSYWTSVYVTDSNGCSSGSLGGCGAVVSTSPMLTVSTDPTVGVPSAFPGIVDAGQTVNFTSAAPVGGLSPYLYTWTGLPTNCPTPLGITVSCTPLTGGLFNISVNVVDANNFSVQSPSLAFTVNTTLAVNLTVSAPVLDLGQNVSFAVTPSFGSPPYAYAWSAPAGLGCPASVTSAVTCTPSRTGTFPASVVVIDGAGKRVSSARSVTVDPDPTVGLLGVNATDVGRTLQLQANGSGGSAPYRFTWGYPPQLGCSAPVGANLTCTPSATGADAVDVVLTDSTGTTATFAFSIQVSADPTVTIQGPSATDVSGPILLVAAPTGGTNPFVYAWSYPSKLGCAASVNATLACTPAVPGNLSVLVVATDLAGNAPSASFTVHVDPALTATLVGPITVPADQSFHVEAQVSGGASPYTFVWSSPAGLNCASSTTSSLSCAPSTGGTATVRVVVIDSTNTTATASLPVKVSPPPPPPPPPTLANTFWIWWWVPLFFGVVIVLLLVRSIRQRRREGASERSGDLEDGGGPASTPKAAAPATPTPPTTIGEAPRGEFDEDQTGPDLPRPVRAELPQAPEGPPPPPLEETPPIPVETPGPPPAAPEEVVAPGPPPLDFGEVAPGPPPPAAIPSVPCPVCGAALSPGQNCPRCGSPATTDVRARELTNQERSLLRYLELKRLREEDLPRAIPAPPPPSFATAGDRPETPEKRETALCPKCHMPLTRLDQVCSNCDLLSRNLMSISPSPATRGSGSDTVRESTGKVKRKKAERTTKSADPAPTETDTDPR